MFTSRGWGQLEAMSLYFWLRRFSNYLVGAPQIIYSMLSQIISFCVRTLIRVIESIRTDRIKLRHQDVRYNVVYQEGKPNEVDFTSRRAKPLQKLTRNEKEEAEKLNKLSIGITNIAMHKNTHTILPEQKLSLLTEEVILAKVVSKDA